MHVYIYRSECECMYLSYTHISSFYTCIRQFTNSDGHSDGEILRVNFLLVIIEMGSLNTDLDISLILTNDKHGQLF